MTRKDLRKHVQRGDFRAVVLSDGCRSYLIEIRSNCGAGLLRDRRGAPMVFRSLGEVHSVMRECGVEDIVLRQRLAHDEVDALSAEQPAFHDQPLKVAAF